jgi:hypothetical protein
MFKTIRTLRSLSTFGGDVTGLNHFVRAMLILTWCIAACGDVGDSQSAMRLSCLGATQNTCSQDPLCVSVMAMNSCEAQACDGTYIGCLPIDADCTDRDEALCRFEQGCLSIYTTESEYIGCETQLCARDEDCVTEQGYACYGGFIDGQKRCRQGPISCNTQTDCPESQRCEMIGEDAFVCF